MAISGDALLDDFQIKQLEFAEANPPIDNVSSAEDEATLEPQISKARKRRLKAKEAKKVALLTTFLAQIEMELICQMFTEEES